MEQNLTMRPEDSAVSSVFKFSTIATHPILDIHSTNFD